MTSTLFIRTGLHLDFPTFNRFSASAPAEVAAEAVAVAIAAPPADGEANTELIRYLAEVLELKKSHISLDKVPETY